MDQINFKTVFCKFYLVHSGILLSEISVFGKLCVDTKRMTLIRVSIKQKKIRNTIPVLLNRFTTKPLISMICSTPYSFWREYLKSLSKWGIPNCGVRTAILNFTDFSCRQCKLNFEPLQGHVKSCHLPEKIEARRSYFYFFIQISWHNWQKTTWKTLQTEAWIMLFGYKNT